MKITKILTLTTITAGLALTSCKKDDETDENNTSAACSLTITNADGPQVGDSYISLDADYNEHIIDSLKDISGSDKTWDFSSLTSSGDGDSLVFEGASSIPLGVDANLALGDDEELYFKSSATGFDLVDAAFADDEDIEFEITNPLSIIPYSLKMNKSITDEFLIEATVLDTIDTVLPFIGPTSIPLEIDISQSNSNEFTVDGCGKVITPKGEFNCLRYIVEPGDATHDVDIVADILGTPTDYELSQAEMDEYIGDEDFNMFEGTTYVWITKEHGYPVLQVTLDENGDVDFVQYLE